MYRAVYLIINLCKVNCDLDNYWQWPSWQFCYLSCVTLTERVRSFSSRFIMIVQLMSFHFILQLPIPPHLLAWLLDHQPRMHTWLEALLLLKTDHVLCHPSSHCWRCQNAATEIFIKGFSFSFCNFILFNIDLILLDDFKMLELNFFESPIVDDIFQMARIPQ